MVRKIIAVILFLYAARQIVSAPVTISQISRSMGLAQLFWALVAILGGIYLWCRGNKKPEAPPTEAQGSGPR